MSKTVVISDRTYNLLKGQARRRELDNVEQFLNKLAQEEIDQRRQVGDEIIAFQERMREKYGVMPDSVDLIREDRDR